MVIYEFHQNRAVEDFDYHQIYDELTPVRSALFTPEHRDFVEKVQKVRTKCATDPAVVGQNRLYLEWDNPLGGELKAPSPFIDFGPWWHNPTQDLPTNEVWNLMLLETARAAGLDLTLDDIPLCPDVSPFLKVTYGFFPARDQSEPWFRVACTKTVAECPAFAEQLGFSTKWFEKFDLNEYCHSCLISFNVSKSGISKPAAEMILKSSHSGNVPSPFEEFEGTLVKAKELILEHHGDRLARLSLSHFKVTLTDESYDKGEAKMYLYGPVKSANG